MKILQIFRSYAFISLGLVVQVIGCRPSGALYGQWKFYPNSSKPEDPNKYSASFMTQSINGNPERWNIKKYFLTIYDDRISKSDKNGILYSEEGEISIDIPQISMIWDNLSEIKITTTGGNGKILFERTLEYDKVEKKFLRTSTK
jgi:hypothetical protein